ncbi:MAG: hypothetical protein Q8N07_01370 [Rhodocyclaceae bacterium]|nr:hypothetical protein [Rhodocyclaceae bacterium]
MNRRRLTLIEVLQPQCFKTTPERSRVTRTIVQPEIDSFEQMEAQASATEKSAAERRADANTPNTLVSLVTQQLAPQHLVVA